MYEWIVIFSVQYLYLFIACIALGYFLIARKSVKLHEVAIISLMAFGLALVIDKILNQIIDSPRPFVIEKVSPLVSHVADNGFPSEHALLVFLIAGTVFLLNKKMGIALSILALGVGVGSVLARVHHPIDVLGSVGIVFFSVAMSRYVFFNVLSKEKPSSI